MTTMTFELPESYRAYCGDAAVRTAVSHILSADSKTPLALPTDIEWKDLPEQFPRSLQTDVPGAR